jgi:cysteine desulfurase
MKPPVYLDNNATTPLDPAVRATMLRYLGDDFANPSSPYGAARAAALAVAEAREAVGRLIDASPGEILFTGCGTESNNAAIRAMLALSAVEGLAAAAPRKKIVATRVEHASVLNLLLQLESQGIPVVWLDVDREGRLDLERLAAAIDAETAGVSVMTANNETGIVFPVAEVARIAKAKGVLFHTDAVQAAGKIPFSVREVAADYVALGAHKLHGPKGVGALYIRKGAPFTPLLVGGEQEQGRRGGTENVAGIAGFGKAAELARAAGEGAAARMRRLRDILEERIRQIGRVRVVGEGADRLPNTALFLIEGVESEALLALLDMEGICCSSGSACASGSSEPSHVLRAMGCSPAEARSALRVSLSRFTTEAEVNRLLEVLPRSVASLRASGRPR